MSAEPLEGAIVRLASVQPGLEGIVFLHTVTSSGLDLERLYAALAIARGLAASSPRPKFCLFVTAEALAPAFEAICRPLQAELTEIAFDSLEVNHSNDPQVTAELVFGGPEVQFALRQLADLPVSLPAGEKVVVFAGGARGIGAVCAGHLAAETPCRLVFLGRTRLTDEARALASLPTAARQLEMQRFLRDYRATEPSAPPRAGRDAWRSRQHAADVLDTLSELRAAGVNAEYHSVDVRDAPATRAALQLVAQQHGRIDLVVHVAGLGGSDSDGRIAGKNWSAIRGVVETKAAGAAHLLAAATELQVPRFISFGSMASRIGGAGQVDYAAANGLLTGIARAHNAAGRLPFASVINWGAWDDVGMAARGGTREVLAAQGVGFIPPRIGAAYFTRVALAEPRALPAEVFVTADMPGLAEIVGTLPGPEARVVTTRWLDPATDPLLRDHRFNGYVFVPAVLYLQFALEAASAPVTEVRDVRFHHALTLVRKPRALLVEVELASVKETRLRFFSEANGTRLLHAEATLAHGTTPNWSDVSTRAPDVTGVQRTRTTLYPARFPHGPAYQVLDRVNYYPEHLVVAGSLTSQCPTPEDWRLPLTLLDGALQVDSIARAGFERPGGLPRSIGRITWEPEIAHARTLECLASVQPDHPEQPAELVLFDAHSRKPCLVVSDFRTTASFAALHPEMVPELTR
jgi:NAD(P)-dependent dehydrogenase (short-subunit alcohol dehydrogenase family)